MNEQTRHGKKYPTPTRLYLISPGRKVGFSTHKSEILQSKVWIRPQDGVSGVKEYLKRLGTGYD